MIRVLGVAAVVAFACQAQAAEYNGWKVTPAVVAGKFDRCTAAAPDGNFGVLMFKSGAVSALISDPAGGFAVGPMAVDVAIDGEPAFAQTPARALNAGLALVTLGEGADGVAQLSNHKALKFATPAKAISVDISTATAALAALPGCVDENGGE